jgi:site-specific DNA recombinase
MSRELQFEPPLVSGNRLPELVDHHSTMDEKNLNVGGYIRISTKKDSQLTSIENQKKYIKEWTEINGYNIVRFYTDVKSGAYSYLRNEMQQLREDIKSGKIKGLISKEISRTSRDIMDILELKRSLSTAGAFFISIKENYDSRTDDDEFLLIIHAGLAQKERKTTASRVKITQLLKAREGKTNVPSPAYGYRLSEDRQYIVPDPKTREVYDFIVEKYLEGWGQLKICKYLNSKGIPAKRSSKWHTNSIKTILTNPVYLGITIYNATTLIRDREGRQKRVVRPKEEWIVRYNTHEQLISEEKFRRIQEIVDEKKHKYDGEWSCEKKYLLSGLLYCDVCKGKVYGSKQGFYVDQNRYGQCDTKSKYWNMQRVDEIVMNEIKKFFLDKTMIEDRIKSKQYLFDKSLSREKKDREELQQKLAGIDNAIKRQQEAFENEVLTLDEYKTRMGELREQKNNMIVKLESINRKLEKIDSMEERFRDIKDKVLNYLENIDSMEYSLKEVLIRKLVKRIYIKPDYSIRIEYAFEE